MLRMNRFVLCMLGLGGGFATSTILSTAEGAVQPEPAAYSSAVEFLDGKLTSAPVAAGLVLVVTGSDVGVCRDLGQSVRAVARALDATSVEVWVPSPDHVGVVADFVRRERLPVGRVRVAPSPRWIGADGPVTRTPALLRVDRQGEFTGMAYFDRATGARRVGFEDLLVQRAWLRENGADH